MMNRYMVIDFKENVISSLGKIYTDFEENESQTSSVNCIDKCDLLNTLQEEIKELIDLYDYRVCSHCGKIISEGYCIENGDAYYCSDECLCANMKYEEYVELYNNGNGDSYWTTWGDNHE